MDKGGVLYMVAVGGAAAGLAVALGPQTRRMAVGGDDPGRDVPLSTFVNYETGQVHPVDMTPDGSTLLVCNTADARLMIFDISSGVPVLTGEVPVGIDPISVRARTSGEAWVVNSISDTVSVVSLATRNVVATIKTQDEPSDVVFAGTPQRAFVTCSQTNTVQVFDPADIATAPVNVSVRGEDPRALAVSPDGQTVYAAVFHSGNGTTILGGSNTNFVPGLGGFPPNAAQYNDGPYGGQNPPPNSGTSFVPVQLPGNPLPPKVSHIVRKDDQGRWMDDNGRDWTAKVSGPLAADSGRVQGWDLPDRDLAVISASSLSVSYHTRLMNICAGLGVNPATGRIAVVGTEAINHVRFEPNVKGRFVQSVVALVDPATGGRTVTDLNPHLVPYTQQLVPQAQRDRSLGDPRSIVWNAAGTRGYVTGLGSNNIVVIDAAGARAGLSDTIEVGEGPTGLAVDDGRGRLYVLNRFAGSISVVSTATEQVVATVPFFDPTPTAIKVGRKHLYDTHKNSGLGQTSCASCHVDARMDRLAWDLGDPQGAVVSLAGQNLGAGIIGLTQGSADPPFQPFHPMKGPMVTQTFQDIIGKEPLHWRGDRDGIEEFNGAFTSLLGDDTQLTTLEMQEFEDFLATIVFPPNPYRTITNGFPSTLNTGQFTSDRFGAAGQPLPAGRPQVGLDLFRGLNNRRIDTGAFTCVQCHSFPAGIGADSTNGAQFPIGPMGEHHAQLVTFDNSFNVTLKTPHLRNAYLKLGFECSQQESLSGFGFTHDGAVDSIARFCSLPHFDVNNSQEVADLTAFIMCFSGGDLPLAGGVVTPSKDSHAAVGVQTTLVSYASAPAPQQSLITQMISLAQAGRIGLIVKGRVAGEQRGYAYVPASQSFQSDRAGQTLTPTALRDLAAPGSELTYTVVPIGTQTRMGIDRDANGVLDGNEVGACYANCDGSVAAPVLNVADFTCFLQRFAAGDGYANCDQSTAPPVLNVADFTCFLQRFAAGCP